MPVISFQKALSVTAAATPLLARLLGRSPPPVDEPVVPVLSGPPMGFNNWARFECALNESLFVDTMDAMRENGLRDAGYTHINLDDCWPAHQRTASNELIWNSTLFPHGIPWLADYAHQNGFTLGIYEDAGTQTCGGYPGSLGYEAVDAKTFASWGIDYVKLDGCNVPTVEGLTSAETYRQIYERWHTLITSPNVSTPMIFSESAPAYFCCSTNLTDWYDVMDWIPSYGQLARHSDDIKTFSESGSAWSSILDNYANQLRVAVYANADPNYFNDPDFLIADQDLTQDEKRSHFALWAATKAPLIISAYVPDLTTNDLAYLTNRAIIQVDQDQLGQQATPILLSTDWDLLSKSMANGDRVLVALNRANTSASLSVPWAYTGLSAGLTKITDLWTGKTSNHFGGRAVTLGPVPPHGTAIVQLSAWNNKLITPTGALLNSNSLTCITGNDAGLTINPCDATASQVWVWRYGLIELVGSNRCLVRTTAGNVALGSCMPSPDSEWHYTKAGLLVHSASELCLTTPGRGLEGSVTLQMCGTNRNDQTIGVPVGVPIQTS